MIKKTLIFVLSVLVSTFIFADIYFDYPTDGVSLTIGTHVNIQWHGPASEGDQLVTVFITMGNWVEIVDNTHTKAQGGFTWEVGRLKNGTLLTTKGKYRLSLESDDGDSNESPEITLVPQPFGMDLPVNNATLTIGTNCQVQWHGPTYEADQLVATFLYSIAEGWYKYVDNTHTKGQGGFTWEVGKLKDGTVVPPGQYSISLESDDGDAGGPTITLKMPEFHVHIKDFYQKVKKIWIFPDPPCRSCFKLDLKDIRILLAKSKQPHVLKLYKGNQFVAPLGKINKRQSLPDSAKIKLNKNQMNKLTKTGAIQFQLHVFSNKGKLLHKQNVMLQMNKQNMLKFNKSKVQLKQKFK